MSGSALALPPLPSQQRKSSDVGGHSDVPYAPLDTDDTTETPLTQGEDGNSQGEMGLKETYEMTEARPGDATAQLVAIVCSADSISFAPYAHDSQFASLC